MVAVIDIVNRALQGIGTRTTVTAAELANQTSNEAIQVNLILTEFRDRLLRMAPWSCGTGPVAMSYITSLPGTPENQTTAPQNGVWSEGLPIPPWVYQYQYPVTCLRALWIVPTIFTGAPGIFPISSGYAPTSQANQGIRFEVNTDLYYTINAAAAITGGNSYVLNEIITLAGGNPTVNPVGAPAQLMVTSIGAGGSVTGVAVVNTIQGETTSLGGSYYAPPTGTQAQGSTTGAGVGATFSVTVAPQGLQRVINCNLQNAVLMMVRQVIDPNVMDPLFREAWEAVLSAGLAMALTGNTALANAKIALANGIIAQAREVDANEALTVMDHTPDWIRTRGWGFDCGWNDGYEWGGLWPSY